jgi:hypothetical protein
MEGLKGSLGLGVKTRPLGARSAYSLNLTRNERAGRVGWTWGIPKIMQGMRGATGSAQLGPLRPMPLPRHWRNPPARVAPHSILAPYQYPS